MLFAMSDGRDESSRTYTVSANYQESWARRGTVTGVIGAVLIVLGVITVAVGQVGTGVLLLLIGVVAGVIALLIRRGVASTRGHRYSLDIGADRLTVTWRDHVTHLPWADLDHGIVVANGPLARVLEVTPRPGVRYVLPQNARPRMSKKHPEAIEVFILSLLGEREAECLADVSAHVEMR